MSITIKCKIKICTYIAYIGMCKYFFVIFRFFIHCSIDQLSLESLLKNPFFSKSTFISLILSRHNYWILDENEYN
jgi:hypothetical protein